MFYRPEGPKRREDKTIRIGTEVLRMYKRFPERLLDSTFGAYLNYSMLDSGETYERWTKKGPSTGCPTNTSRHGKWKFHGFSTLSPEKQRMAWRKDGFQLPRNFWVGPPELKPVKTKLTESKVNRSFLERLAKRDEIADRKKEEGSFRNKVHEKVDAIEKTFQAEMKALKAKRKQVQYPSFLSGSYWDSNKPMEDWKKRQAGDRTDED